jgi:hypothetical protein
MFLSFGSKNYNAAFFCKMARKVRPPMHEYIRKLLYKDLSKTTTEKVILLLKYIFV